MSKSLAIVASEWVWYVYFNFGYSVSYFYFGKRFWGAKTEKFFCKPLKEGLDVTI